MSDHDDFLDDILGDDDESVGKMLDVAKGGADPADHHDDFLDDLLASPPQSPVKSAAVDADDLDDLDDLLASPGASPTKSPEKQPEGLDSRGSFVPDEIVEMEDMLEAMLDVSSTEKGGSDEEDDLSGALHGNLDDLDLGDFEQVEDAGKDVESQAPVKVSEEAPKPPLEDLVTLEPPKEKAVAPQSKEPSPPIRPAPKLVSKPAQTATVQKNKASRKPAAPKVSSRKPEGDKPIGDLPNNKPKKKPLSFLKKTASKKPSTKANGDKKKPGSKKGLISTFSSWAKRAPVETVSTKTPARKPQPRKLFKSTARKRIQTIVGSPSKPAMTSGRSVCSVTSTDDPRSPTLYCGVQFQPFMHAFRAPCDLCVFYLSDEERLMLDATGRHLRVMYTAGGCCRECSVFPRGKDEAPVRLCRKCYFNAHRDVFQKFVHEQGILQKK